MRSAPWGVELQFWWALLVGGTEGGMGERAAGFLAAAMGILCCFLVWEWTRSLHLKRFWSLGAVGCMEIGGAETGAAEIRLTQVHSRERGPDQIRRL